MEKIKKETLYTKEDERTAKRRLVAKLGSSTICDESGAVRSDLLSSLAKQTKELQQKSVETIFISSGAVAVGRLVAPEVEDKRLLSGIGQSWLSMAWNKAFYPTPVTQLLFTDDQLNDNGYIKKQVETALHYGVIPVINSLNPDTNNDFAGSQVAHAIDANIFALLTTKDGVLRGDKTIPLVRDWDDLAGAITDDTSNFGTGGMRPKCGEAFRFVRSTGGEAIIARGLTEKILHKIAAGEEGVGTRFAHV
ncbi:MAG: hypothetical protein H0W89_06935 [Candidatus Levybacteria bacterium]|nr:hypothetical protein [Candidatus Levybacteria bacterium]